MMLPSRYRSGMVPSRQPRDPLARAPVFSAMVVLATVLTATSNGYGFHRDELYFRMLDPAWGYVDQPPLMPALARMLTSLVDEPWAFRLPATAFAVAGVLVVALIAREFGGGRLAQALAAWGVASAAFPLTFGHVLISAAADLLVWPLVCLFVIRALRQPLWWLAVGTVVGLSTYNKLLIGMLLAGLALGLLFCGPRRFLGSPWLWAGVGLAALIAAPNLIYQASNEWPQLRMGEALGAENGSEVRAQLAPFLLLLLGPPLVPIWIAGLVRAWRVARYLVVALIVVTVATFVGGAQFYYPLGILTVVFAIGCVPAAAWCASVGRRRLVIAGFALNGAVSAVIALPLVPIDVVGDTPLPAVNQVMADSVGWPEYAEQITAAATTAELVIAANYGEAGALDRYAPELAVVSGHNALWFQARPSDSARTVLVIGQRAVAERYFDCREAGRLDNGLGVDSEEQGVPLALCTNPRAAWSEIWPAFAHLD
jgi:4-amino-4-deoxy-L-arabinose transferase-like glycosyltransferase